MDKRLKLLLERKAEIEKHLAEAEKTRNEMDGKMQSRYDTQKEEWASRCDIYQHLLERINTLINQFESLEIISDDKITLGSLFSIRIDNDEPEDFILLEDMGGYELDGVKTLSLQSPIGKAILNAQVGDTIFVEVNNNFLTLKVLCVDNWSKQ